MKTLFKNKNFTLLMGAKFTSLLGTKIQEFALSLYILKLTGSATQFAAALALSIIPEIVLGPIAGVVADWFDRKKIVILLDLISGGAMALFTVAFFLGGDLPVWSVYVLVIVLSIISTGYNPAALTILPSILEKEELPQATGLNSMITQLANLLGPVIGGALFGVFGLPIIMAFNTFSFIIAAIAEVFMVIPNLVEKPKEIGVNQFMKDLKEGLSFIKNEKIIYTIVMVAMVLNFSLGPISVAIIYISKQILKVSDVQLGLMETIMVVSMMISPLFIGGVAKRIKVGKMIFVSFLFVAIGIGLISVAVLPSYLSLFNTNFIPYITILVLCFLIGGVATFANIGVSVMFQEMVPLKVMGRVSTVVNMGCLVLMPLGQMLFGVLFDKIPASICLVLMASIAIFGMLPFRKQLLQHGQESPNVVEMA